jgi:DNA-directed RNA polymerase specialized sigma24 family protein
MIYKLSTKYGQINKLYPTEDLMNEAYFPFLYAREHYNSDKNMSFLSYLHLATNHHFLKVVNGKNRSVNDTVSFSTPLEEDTTVEDLLGKFDDIEGIFQRELKELMERKIYSYLTLKEQEAIFLYYWCELSIDDVALLMNTHKTYARELLVKARRVLRKDPDLLQFYIDNVDNDYNKQF